MNTLKIYPKPLRLGYERSIKNSGYEGAVERYHNSIFILSIFISVIFSVAFYFLKINLLYSLIVFVALNLFFYFKTSMKASSRIKKIEEVFPDVVSLMSSNLKAGITIEKSFLLSARPEFAPLDKEILRAGREISTGKEVVVALKLMEKNIDSEKISKTIELIISGLRAGGNIADLLDQTSRNMKQKELIEKKTASTTLMYVIFIFVAVSVGAPILFGLSSVLVEIILNLSSKVPEATNFQTNLPFTFNKLEISVDFVIYFSLFFMMVTNFFSCFVMGAVNKGEGKAGLKYFIPILAISTVLFFLVRKIISGALFGVLSGV